MYDSKIWIYSKTPFDPSYKNVFLGESQSEVDAILENKNLSTLIYQGDNFSFQKRNNYIHVKVKDSQLENASYMKFTNGERTYYAFINNILYINNKPTTQIRYEIDVWNTYIEEIYRTKIPFHATQLTLPKYTLNNKGEKDLVFSFDPQGFNINKNRLYDIFNLNIPLFWVIFVMKPGFKINGKSPFVIGYVVGSPTPLDYIAVPVDTNFRKTIETELPYGGSVPSEDFERIYQTLSGSFLEEQGTDTVNYCMNIYITLDIGLQYNLENKNGTKRIIITDKNTSLSVLDRFSNGGSSGEQTTDYTNISLSYGGNTLPNEYLNIIIREGKKYRILPEGVISQLYLESNWGTTGVGKDPTQNNWSGITWGDRLAKKFEELGIQGEKGKARPESEGGYYVKFNSMDDFFKYYFYLLATTYNVKGKSNITTFSNGLFKSGGASYNYAAGDETDYKNLMADISSGLRNKNGEDTINNINTFVF